MLLADLKAPEPYILDGCAKMLEDGGFKREIATPENYHTALHAAATAIQNNIGLFVLGKVGRPKKRNDPAQTAAWDLYSGQIKKMLNFHFAQ